MGAARPAHPCPPRGRRPRHVRWLYRNPGKDRERLTREHLRRLEDARDLQRNGDIIGFAAKTAEAAELERRIEELDAATGEVAGSS